jgi:salicylate biosynthesis isochorismate synthase
MFRRSSMSAAFEAEALVQREAGPISVVEMPVTSAFDPITFLERFDAERSFLFERPIDGVAIAALGELSVAGSEVEPGMLRVGGFAFDRARTPEGPWRGFPRTAWAVPRLALVRRPGVQVLRAAATESEGGRSRALSDLEDAFRVLDRPVEVVREVDIDTPGYRLEPLRSAHDWRKAVEDTLADIEAGRLNKAVLARAVRIHADRPWHPWAVARRLRSEQPEATVFALRRGTRIFIGATPERLVRVGAGRIETAAVAGTAAPGGEAAGADEIFLEDRKERLEHRLVVEEIARRLEPLTSDLIVPETPRVLHTAELRHLYTPISGRLRSATGLMEVATELHPTPAVCGLPCGEAMAAIRAREGLERGWFAGAVGWSDAEGGEAVVPLRSALLDGGDALLFAGAGIVAGSDWARELEETRLKLRVMQTALVEV